MFIDAIIFVVDSTDSDRMHVAKEELMSMLEEDDLKNTILMVFANKQDMKGAYPAEQVTEALDLPSIRNRQWTIRETSAMKGDGLYQGFDWLVQTLQAPK